MTVQSAFTFRVEQHALGSVGVVTIDVHGESMNTLKAEFAEQVSAVLEQAMAAKVAGLVFISGKKDSFIAGADIRILDSAKSAAEAEALAKAGQDMFNRIETLPFPTVAAVHGACLGGGLEFAMACDHRVCSLDDKTQMGLPEVQLGLLPGSGGTQRLPRLIGVQKAVELMLTGKSLRAKQAVKAGLVTEAVAQPALLAAAVAALAKGKAKKAVAKRSAMEWALEGNPFGRKVLFDQAKKQTFKKTRGNYPAPDMILDAIATGLESGMTKGLAKEAKNFGLLCMTPESKALRSIFFATTEMKKESGAGEAQPRAVAKVGVLGGGLMGAGITHVTACKANVLVRVKDVSHKGISGALNYSYAILAKKLKRKQMTRAELEAQMARITGGTDYTAYHDVDVVIEAVFEDLALKQSMVADIEQQAKANTIFATNTSSLPIAQIAEKAARPENVVGLHYFSPVEKMPLVEVIPHATTSPETVATVVALARKQGKTPIVVKDGAGFYVNRILALYMNEAANVVLAGEPIDHLDNALLDFGFPVGPMTLLDEVGIDVGSKISPILERELGERFAAPAVFNRLIDDGRLGKKNGRGFYVHGKDAKKGKKQVDDTVYSLLGVNPESRHSAQQVAKRCVLQMLNEAARCLEEGIIQNARDGDIGAIFGIGFPPFLGGPFRYMDSLGAASIVRDLEQLQAEFGSRFAPCELLQTMAKSQSKFYE